MPVDSIGFKFKRKLLGELCRCAVRALLIYFQAAIGEAHVFRARALRQCSPGNGAEYGRFSRDARDERGGSQAHPLQGPGGPNSEAS